MLQFAMSLSLPVFKDFPHYGTLPVTALKARTLISGGFDPPTLKRSGRFRGRPHRRGALFTAWPIIAESRGGGASRGCPKGIRIPLETYDVC